MGHIQNLSFESLIKMDHFQKEQPVNLKGTTGALDVLAAPLQFAISSRKSGSRQGLTMQIYST
jgi:hypothetical protein